MPDSRRQLFLRLLAALGAICLRPKSLSAQNPVIPPPLPRGDEQSQGPPNNPPGSTTKSVLEQNQKSIKKDIEKLFDLATELKSEVEKTDSTAVLSIPLVKKAEEIEKLAKQIKEHARG
jgi:hypothetical protein